MAGSKAPGFAMGDEHPKPITQKKMKADRATVRLKELVKRSLLNSTEKSSRR
jgi:hypothetical protein